MVEIPADVALEEVSKAAVGSRGEGRRPAGNPQEVPRGHAPCSTTSATMRSFHAGQGVLLYKATDELLELTELLQDDADHHGGREHLPRSPCLGLGQRQRRHEPAGRPLPGSS